MGKVVDVEVDSIEQETGVEIQPDGGLKAWFVMRPLTQNNRCEEGDRDGKKHSKCCV